MNRKKLLMLGIPILAVALVTAYIFIAFVKVDATNETQDNETIPQPEQPTLILTEEDQKLYFMLVSIIGIVALALITFFLFYSKKRRKDAEKKTDRET